MNCTSKKYITPHRSIEYVDSGKPDLPILVDCGKCIPCLTHKRQEWVIRLEQEFKHSTGALFVTLTYDQKHMPSDYALSKKHVQDYMKRLRKRDGTNKIRYYLTGEYGSKSGRPHYHVLLFNTTEEHARNAWTDSRGKSIGIIHFGKITMASIAYCTKYLVQPELKIEGKQKPFALMSRGYGIGAHYLTDEMVAWHKEDDRNYIVSDKKKIRLPRFYKSKIWYHEKDKEQVSSKSKKFSIEQAEKEMNYYRKKHGDRAEQVKAISELAVIQRVKNTIKFTQTF